MLADTDAIRALGSANSTQAGDLAEVAATLSSLPIPAASPLGPIGDRFISALVEAAGEGARAVSVLGSRLSASGRTAYAAAAAYEDTDHVAGSRVAEV
jgi:hypothetical protein